VLVSGLFSLFRTLIDIIETSRADRDALQAEVLALRRQVQVLERQVKRVRWTPGDRMLMAALAKYIPSESWGGLLLKPETVIGWHRALVRRKWASYRGRPRRGRPPIEREVVDLIVTMARENSTWGYFYIKGELQKLGYRVSATSIRSILKRTGIPPAGRRAELTWKQFLAAHAESLVASDFFSVDTIAFKRLFVLIYVHLATRKVLWAAVTADPHQDWLAQQSRNLLWEVADHDLELGALIHDHDKKFSPAGDRIIRAAGCRVILTPLMAPKANAHAERWVGSCRRDVLDWMIIVNENHLRHVIREYVAHYNDDRPHRSCGLRPPASRGDPRRHHGPIVIHSRLGGLLRSYHRGSVAAT
jgi:putative transposase